MPVPGFYVYKNVNFIYYFILKRKYFVDGSTFFVLRTQCLVISRQKLIKLLGWGHKITKEKVLAWEDEVTPIPDPLSQQLYDFVNELNATRVQKREEYITQILSESYDHQDFIYYLTDEDFREFSPENHRVFGGDAYLYYHFLTTVQYKLNFSHCHHFSRLLPMISTEYRSWLQGNGRENNSDNQIEWAIEYCSRKTSYSKFSDSKDPLSRHPFSSVPQDYISEIHQDLYKRAVLYSDGKLSVQEDFWSKITKTLNDLLSKKDFNFDSITVKLAPSYFDASDIEDARQEANLRFDELRCYMLVRYMPYLIETPIKIVRYRLVKGLDRLKHRFPSYKFPSYKKDFYIDPPHD
jgi:hypothetical protein